MKMAGKHGMLLYYVAILSMLPLIIAADNEVTCYECYGLSGTCNSTHCYPVTPCKNTCTVIGSCMVISEIHKYTGDVSMNFICFPQSGSFEYLYQGKPLTQNQCVQSTTENAMDEDFNKMNISSINCQCLGDLCNGLIVLQNQEEEIIENNLDSIVLKLLGGIVGLILVIVIVLLWRWRVTKQRHEDEKAVLQEFKQNRHSSDGSSLLDGLWDESGKNSCSTYKYSTSLSSGYSRHSKANALNHNHQHLPIELLEVVGRGQYAEVWKAKLRQDPGESEILSVKVFRLHNYGAWRQEKEILAQSWMRHENIIEYHTSEQHSQHSKSRPQYWLITAFYKRGNLQSFLRNNTLSWSDFMEMAMCIAKGLAYLHSEQDQNNKPKLPIAHRDIKSCNILVKDDGRSCVLADLGLSFKLDPNLTRDELANAGQVGTSRYMAPELLERLVNLADIESFKRVDVYAMALVMWELMSRCEVTEPVHPYQAPFGSQITDRPTKEQMLVVVCRQKQKPDILEEWRNHQYLRTFIDDVEECWDYDPDSRITASCFYERLCELKQTSLAVDEDCKPKEVTVVRNLSRKIENEINEITELLNVPVA